MLITTAFAVLADSSLVPDADQARGHAGVALVFAAREHDDQDEREGRRREASSPSSHAQLGFESSLARDFFIEPS